MEPSSNIFGIKPGTFAAVSLAAGIASLLLIFYPPAQLLLGASAVLLACLSKKPGCRFGGSSIAGMILGTLGIFMSIILFINFVAIIRLLDNPDSLLSIIDDPAAAAQLKDMISQYRSMINNMKS